MRIHRNIRNIALPVCLAALAFAGCARQMQREVPPPMEPTLEESTTGEVESTAPAAPTPRTPRPKPTQPRRPPAGSEELPVTPAEPMRESTGTGVAGSPTGVPVCDIYLMTYKQCYATIGQSSPAQIDERYDRIRDTLVGKSGTPEGRSQISNLCKQFNALIEEALDGRKCGDPPK